MEGLNFWLYSFPINLNMYGHTWLVAIRLEVQTILHPAAEGSFLKPKSDCISPLLKTLQMLHCHEEENPKP